MNKLSKDTQKLAALAVFSSLYNANKDIYTVISEFVKQIYVINGFHSSYTIDELRLELEDKFGFDNIPHVVVKTAVSKRLNLIKDSNSGRYFVSSDDIDTYQTISNDLHEAESDSELILVKLIAFYERQTKEQVTETIKEDLQCAIYQYIFNDKIIPKYSDLINLFIVEYEKDEQFSFKLQQIFEGCLIQSALRYQSTPNQLDKFNNKLCIFLDTEIIFHLAGYNGSFYQTLAEEFILQVDNMNKEIQKCHKEKKILLRYFEEVDNEIEIFFDKAEKIVANRMVLDRSNNAMVSIVGGCSVPSDVLGKKSDLKLLLKKYDIVLDNKYSYYENENQEYNIEDFDFVNNILNPEEAEKIKDSLKLLSHINVRRGCRGQNIFNNVGFILLTGNETTRRLSCDERILKKGNVPLATDLSYLTNRFWFTTHQSFSISDDIQSFKISTRARMAVSASIAHKAQLEYKKIKQEYDDGKLSNERIAEQISELQQYPTMPEKVLSEQENITDYYVFLNNGVEQLIEEKSIEKRRKDEVIKEQNKIILDKDATISEQDKKIKYLEERPKRICWHIILFFRFIFFWSILLFFILILIKSLIKIFCTKELEVIDVLSFVVGVIVPILEFVNKKIRLYLLFNSFGRSEVEKFMLRFRK